MKQKTARFANIFVARFIMAEVPSSSVLITYYLVLGIVPLVVGLASLLPLLHINPNVVTTYASVLLPREVATVLTPVIQQVLTQKSAGTLSLSIVGALWAASRGGTYLQRGINKAYGLPDRSSYLAKRLFSLVMVGLMAALLGAFALVFSVGEMVLQLLQPVLPAAGDALQSLIGLKWPITAVVLAALMVLVYWLTPNQKQPLRSAWPGAVLATAGLMGLAQAFTLYVRLVARSFSSYGALSTLFVMMLWLHLTCIWVMLGAVLNAAISEYRQSSRAPALQMQQGKK